MCVAYVGSISVYFIYMNINEERGSVLNDYVVFVMLYLQFINGRPRRL